MDSCGCCMLVIDFEMGIIISLCKKFNLQLGLQLVFKIAIDISN
jgi:hypothetical protein